MGCGSSEQSGSSSSTQDMTQQTTFAKRTPAEQAILDQLSGLGTSQRDALMQQIQSLTSGASPYALSPADQQQLDQSYGSAQQQLNLQNKDYADFLSGSRGMRMSDTPISSQAFQRQALGQADLLSNKANMGLNLGMGASQYRMNSALGLANSLPQGLVAAFNPQFQERLAGGTQSMHGTSSSTSNQVNTPSLMSQIGQGIGIAGQLGAMAMPFLAPGVGSLGAGAGAGASMGGASGLEGLTNHISAAGSFGPGW
jgi:hypothetical protein